MLPGQSGKMIATFISTSTSPAAGSGRSRLNASITAQTAKSCISQPTSWHIAAPSAGTGRRRTASPWRAMISERAQAPHPVVHAAAAGAGEEEADHQEDEADEPEDDQARHGPVRDLRRQQDPGDEDRDREEVEQAVREDGAEQGRARSPAVREVPAQHRDARELAGPGRQHRVPEQPDPEGGEHLAEAWVRLGQRLVDRQPPRERAREDGEEVEQDADDHPAPGDRVERVVDGVPLGATPPDREQGGAEQGEHEQAARPGIASDARRAASRSAPRVGFDRPLVDALEPAGDVAPRVPLDRERPGRLAHRDATRLVGEERR